MSQLHDAILEWTESGRLKPEDSPRALEIAGIAPQSSDWREFLRTLLLWSGMILLVSGVVFFFAYNWQAMPRFVKFGLAETLLAAAFVAAWFLNIDRPAGKGALCAAAVLTGALLALAGQTYQTGADTFELFAYWALLIFPWVIAGRFSPLWLLWMGLINLSVIFYFDSRSRGMVGFLFGASGMLWGSLAVNAIATVAWEFGLARDTVWLNRWGARALVTCTGIAASTLGFLFAIESRQVGVEAILAYIVCMAVIYFYYRHRVFDVYPLSAAVLSGVIVITAFMSRHILFHADPAAFLFVGLLVIGMSAAGAWWIRKLSKEQPE